MKGSPNVVCSTFSFQNLISIMSLKNKANDNHFESKCGKGCHHSDGII